MKSELIIADYLEHHGVKGMKWGVRSAKNTAARVQLSNLNKKQKAYNAKGASDSRNKMRVRRDKTVRGVGGFLSAVRVRDAYTIKRLGGGLGYQAINAAQGATEATLAVKAHKRLKDKNHYSKVDARKSKQKNAKMDAKREKLKQKLQHAEVITNDFLMHYGMLEVS